MSLVRRLNRRAPGRSRTNGMPSGYGTLIQLSIMQSVVTMAKTIASPTEMWPCIKTGGNTSRSLDDMVKARGR